MSVDLRLHWKRIDRHIDEAGGEKHVLQRARLDRVTVWRWRQGTLPHDPAHLLRLAVALDLDPLLLFEFERESFVRSCWEAGRVLAENRDGRLHPALGLVEQFMRCGDAWPPTVVHCRRKSEAPLAMRWHTRDLLHDGSAGRHRYSPILLTPRGDGETAQVWHIARRHPTLENAVWHPFGAVALADGRLMLTNFVDLFAAMPATGPVAFETWFGEADERLRIASLRAFDAHIATAPPASVLRFQLPRVQVTSPTVPPLARARPSVHSA